MKKVMIIDVNPSNIKMMDLMLTKAGFRTDCILKPEFALDLIKETKPDLILMDVNMPEINGFKLCKKIKKDKDIKDIPVIFVSALSDVKYIAGGLAIGAVDYITKPIKPDELVARVSIHMELAKKRQKLQKNNDILQTELNIINMEDIDKESDFLYSLMQLKQGYENPQNIERIKAYFEHLLENLIINSPYKTELNKDFVIEIIKKYF